MRSGAKHRSLPSYVLNLKALTCNYWESMSARMIFSRNSGWILGPAHLWERRIFSRNCTSKIRSFCELLKDMYFSFGFSGQRALVFEWKPDRSYMKPTTSAHYTINRVKDLRCFRAICLLLQAPPWSPDEAFSILCTPLPYLFPDL